VQRKESRGVSKKQFSLNRKKSEKVRSRPYITAENDKKKKVIQCTVENLKTKKNNKSGSLEKWDKKKKGSERLVLKTKKKIKVKVVRGRGTWGGRKCGRMEGRQI